MAQVDKAIDISPAEAMLIDWVLTMHAFDISRLEQLETPFMIGLRKQIAPLIVGDQEAGITFSEKALMYLLIAVPITFRFYKEDIGFSLKKKLLTTLLPPKIEWAIKEETDESDSSKGSSKDTNSASKDSASKDDTQDSPQDSP